MISECQ